MASVTIITPTFNNPELMDKCILNVAIWCDVQDLNWVIINNDTEDTSLRYEKELAYHEISGSVLKHDNSGNFATWCNYASNYAETDHILFLNNDVMAKSDFIKYQKALLKNTACKVAGSILYYPDGKLQHAGVVFTENVRPGNLGEKAIEVCGLDPNKVDPKKWENPTRFKAVTGAALMMRTEDFRTLHGFHEEFNMAFEDVDLCLRACKWLNGHCAIDSRSVLEHIESASGGDRNVEFNCDLLRSRWLGFINTDYSQFI